MCDCVCVCIQAITNICGFYHLIQTIFTTFCFYINCKHIVWMHDALKFLCIFYMRKSIFKRKLDDFNAQFLVVSNDKHIVILSKWYRISNLNCIISLRNSFVINQIQWHQEFYATLPKIVVVQWNLSYTNSLMIFECCYLEIHKGLKCLIKAKNKRV